MKNKGDFVYVLSSPNAVLPVKIGSEDADSRNFNLIARAEEACAGRRRIEKAPTTTINHPGGAGGQTGSFLHLPESCLKNQPNLLQDNRPPPGPAAA